MAIRPVVLIVLDGFGVHPGTVGNAISRARTPVLDDLLSNYPSTSLDAAGISVGLAWGEVGNSEVGHQTMGAGRVAYQNAPRISLAIEDGNFFTNPTLLHAAEHVKKYKSRLHIVGITSPGGVHGTLDHLYALLQFAKEQKISEVYIHAILDGRDTPPNSAIEYINELEENTRRIGVGEIATLVGRYFAMDRNNNWDRTEVAYKLMVEGEGFAAKRPQDAIKENYNQNVFDEKFPPTYIAHRGKPLATIQDNDAVIFFNFRADRARQLTTALVLPGFEKFPRSTFRRNILMVTMTDYEESLPVEVAFPNQNIPTPLAKVISNAGMHQMHIAETEKYAHVTYFFNGGLETPFPLEERALIPSHHVATYDLDPEMSAREITEKTIASLFTGRYAFILVNFANPDMVGHTGKMDPTIKGVETVDQQIGQIIEAVLSINGAVIITADHGNAEEKVDPRTGAALTEHTANPVPFILVANSYHFPEPQAVSEIKGRLLKPTGILADVAPTVLDLLGLAKPDEMTGESLLPYLQPFTVVEEKPLKNSETLS